MSLLSGTFSFVRYTVVGEEPEPFWQTVDEKIRTFAFREIQGGTEEVSMGWVGLDNMLDTEFSYAHYSVGDYLVLSFRVDKKIIPGTVLKKYVLETERKLKQESGRKKISRQERVEMREQTRLKLLASVLPVPKLYDVCWCISKKWLLFSGTGNAVRSDFESYFARCFDLSLSPYSVWDPASAPEETARKLITLEPDIYTD